VRGEYNHHPLIERRRALRKKIRVKEELDMINTSRFLRSGNFTRMAMFSGTAYESNEKIMQRMRLNYTLADTRGFNTRLFIFLAYYI